jgi:signal recognition particle receptor subunit beta
VLLAQTGDFVQGCIVVVDGSKPETFIESKSIVETFGAYPEMAPPVMAAVRLDAPDAWTAAELRIVLRLDDRSQLFRTDRPITLLACDEHSQRSTAAVVARLAEQMPDANFGETLRGHLMPGY